MRRGLKYNNIKTCGFSSRKEYRRYNELKLLERAGKISNLKCQVSYELIPSQYAIVNGKKKCVERSVRYIGDFQYVKDGDIIVEDTKGFRTKDYILKRKLMRHVYGIEIIEV